MALLCESFNTLHAHLKGRAVGQTSTPTATPTVGHAVPQPTAGIPTNKTRPTIVAVATVRTSHRRSRTVYHSSCRCPCYYFTATTFTTVPSSSFSLSSSRLSWTASVAVAQPAPSLSQPRLPTQSSARRRVVRSFVDGERSTSSGLGQWGSLHSMDAQGTALRLCCYVTCYSKSSGELLFCTFLPCGVFLRAFSFLRCHG